MVSRAARLYIGLVVSAAAVLVAAAILACDREMMQAHFWTPSPALQRPLAALLTLQALFLVCDSGATPMTSRQTRRSPS